MSRTIADIIRSELGTFADLPLPAGDGWLRTDCLFCGGSRAALHWRAGWYGNTGNPGYSNEAGVILRKYAAHAGTTGQAPADFSEPSILLELVRAVNAEPTALLCSPQLEGTLSRLNAASVAKYWQPPSDVAHLWPPVYSTTIPTVETDPLTGVPAQTGGTMTSLYCGDFSRVIFGARLGVGDFVQIMRERFLDSKQVGMASAVRASIRLSHPESFVRSYGALTT